MSLSCPLVLRQPHAVARYLRDAAATEGGVVRYVSARIAAERSTTVTVRITLRVLWANRDFKLS